MHHVEPLHNPPEYRVDAVEMGAVPLIEYDEELAPPRVLPRVRHRKRPLLVGPRIPLRLALDGVARPPTADPAVVQRQVLGLRITPLHHELRNHPVKDDSVIESVLHQLFEVLHRARRILRVELGGEGTLVGLECC